MTMTDERNPGSPSRPVALGILLFLLTVWSAWFIFRTSFEIEGRRYFCLFDDAMISMTYARNLVEGHGLNWARWGQPVEGFTHPLWILMMIPINALGLPLADRSLLVQLVSLLCLVATVAAVARLVLAHFCVERACHWLFAAVLTAFYYPLLYWSLLGMETALQALLVVLAVHLALDAVHSGRDRHLPLWLVSTAALLLRLDMALLVVAVQLYVLVGRGLRPAGRRSWLAGLAIFCGATLAYSLFRWFYFHDVLPNTYYLKIYGVPLVVRVLRGLELVAVCLRAHLPLMLAAVLGTGAAVRRNPRLLLPAIVVALYLAYDVYVGGDVWEKDINVRANRFEAFVLPLLFVLLNGLLNEGLAAWRRWRSTGSESSVAQRFALACITAAALFCANGLWLSDQADDNWRNLTVTQRPPLVDAQHKVVARTLLFLRLVQPQAVVATAWAGIPAYFSNYRMIDILGYNDRKIAREPPVEPVDEDNFDSFVPGHDKFDEHRLLVEQRPDAFFQIWGVRQEIGLPVKVMTTVGYRKVEGFWMRADSPYVAAGPPGPEEEEPPESGRPAARRRHGPHTTPVVGAASL